MDKDKKREFKDLIQFLQSCMPGVDHRPIPSSPAYMQAARIHNSMAFYFPELVRDVIVWPLNETTQFSEPMQLAKNPLTATEAQIKQPEQPEPAEHADGETKKRRKNPIE